MADPGGVSVVRYVSTGDTPASTLVEAKAMVTVVRAIGAACATPERAVPVRAAMARHAASGALARTLRVIVIAPPGPIVSPPWVQRPEGQPGTPEGCASLCACTDRSTPRGC